MSKSQYLRLSNLRHGFALILTLVWGLSFSGCAGLPGVSTETGGGNATDTNTETDSPSGEGETEIQAYMPPPSNEEVIITAPDNQGVSYLMGNNLDSNFVLVAQWDPTTVMRSTSNYLARIGYHFSDFLWNTVGVTSAEAATASIDCSSPPSGTACFTIDGGATEGPLTGISVNSSVQLSYLDPSTEDMSEDAADEPLENLVYMADGAAGTQAIAEDDGNLFVVTEGAKVLKLGYDETEGRILMQSGSIADGYEMVQAPEGTVELDLDSINMDDDLPLMIMRTPDEVVARRGSGDRLGDTSLSCYRGDSEGECSSRYVCDAAEDCIPKMVKVRGGKVYFSTGNTSGNPASNGMINELYNNNAERIEFLTIDDSDDQLNETLAFDIGVDSQRARKEYLVVFENHLEKVTLFGKYNREGIQYVRKKYILGDKSDIGNILDLQITVDQDRDSPANGEAFLLSETTLYFIDYNLLGNFCPACVSGITVSSSLDLSNAKASTVSTDKRYAFVLSNDSSSESSAGDYITVIDLENRVQVTNWENMVDGKLTLQLSGKTVADFNPTTIHYYKDSTNHGHLILSTQQFNSSLVVSLPEGI